MKKLKLSFSDYGNAEVLSREQLKKIMGGDGSGDDGVVPMAKCSCDGSSSFTCSCNNVQTCLNSNCTNGEGVCNTTYCL